MPTSEDTMAFIEDMLGDLNWRTARMFGEYCIYVDTKPVAFVTDDTLCIKPSEADAALFERTTPGEAYPGSKLYHRVSGDQLEDRDWLQEALQATADALPLPAPKKPRTAKK